MSVNKNNNIILASLLLDKNKSGLDKFALIEFVEIFTNSCNCDQNHVK